MADDLQSCSGLYKFDGTSWTYYFECFYTGTILVDTSGDVWYASSSGEINKYDGVNWTQIQFPEVIGNVQENFYPNGTMTIDKQNNMWFGGQIGNQGTYQIIKVSGTNQIIYDSLPFIPGAMAVDSQENLWVGASNKVEKFDGNSWTTYDTSNSSLANRGLNGIVIDKEDNKWFIQYAIGVSKYDGNNWTTYNALNSGLITNKINSLTVDNANNKWFGTDSGLIKYDGVTWTNYKPNNGGGFWVDGIAIDNQNNVWIGDANGASELIDPNTSVANIPYIDNKLVCYPNPANDILNISTPNSSNAKISLQDITGRIIYNVHTDGTGIQTLHLDNLPDGIYMATYSSSEEVVTLKVIKQ